MGTTNQRRTWGRKPCLVGENREKNSRREDDEPDEGKLPQKEPATAHENVWFMHYCALAHFSIAVRNQFHATYSERWLARGRHAACSPRSSDLNPLDFFCGHLKFLVYKTPVTTGEDFTVWIVVASAHRICLNASDNVGVGCCMPYAAAISNNSCDNHLSLHFWRRAVMHCSYCRHALRLINVFLASYCPF
ncbi:hypothetical protein TNCV_4521571 [Trichonephila clavipes]|nr:hypothetical protein TNCV_4521571 [Trichonephila clavipes]